MWPLSPLRLASRNNRGAIPAALDSPRWEGVFFLLWRLGLRAEPGGSDEDHGTIQAF